MKVTDRCKCGCVFEFDTGDKGDAILSRYRSNWLDRHAACWARVVHTTEWAKEQIKMFGHDNPWVKENVTGDFSPEELAERKTKAAKEILEYRQKAELAKAQAAAQKGLVTKAKVALDCARSEISRLAIRRKEMAEYIEKLEAENKKLQPAANRAWTADIAADVHKENLRKAICINVAEVARVNAVMAALKFYALKDTWKGVPKGTVGVKADRGQLAEDALKEAAKVTGVKDATAKKRK